MISLLPGANNNFSLDNLAPYETPAPSLKDRLLKKINDFIEMIFKFIKRIIRRFPALSQSQIKLIHQTKETIIRRIPATTVITYSPMITFEQLSQTQPVPLKKADTPVLNQLSEFIEKFSHVLVNECLYKRKIEPVVGDTKNTLIDGIDAVKNGFEVVKNIQNAIISFVKLVGISDFEDPSGTILIQQLFQVFLLPSKTNANPRKYVESILKAKIEQLFQERKISQDQMYGLSKNIPKILSWLFQSNNWLLNTNYPIQLHQFFLDISKFIDNTSSILTNDEIEPEIQQIKNLIENGFAEDLKEVLEINTQSISSFIAIQLNNFIENLPFTEVMDDILNVFLNHLYGFKAGENAYEQQKSLISDAEKTVAKPAKNGNEGLNQEEARDFLNIVKEDGEAQSNSKESFNQAKENYLNNRFNEAFSNHSACHPTVAADVKVKDKKTKQKQDEEYYSKLIKKLYACLLPPQKITLPSGHKVEIDGIVAILNKLILPQRWEEIRKMGEKIFNKILEMGNFQDAANFKNHSYILGKVLVLEMIRDKIEQHIVTALRDYIPVISSTEFLEYIMAVHMMPLQLDKGFVAWTRTTLALHVKEISEHFAALVSANPVNFTFPNPNPTLLTLIYDLMKSKFMDFNLEESQITIEKFKVLIDPLIAEIQKYLNQKLILEKQGTEISAEMLVEELTNFFSTTPIVPTKSIYGDLTMALLFDIGEFGGKLTQALTGLAKPLISQEASQVMHDLTKSYHCLVSNSVDFASKRYLNPIVLDEIIFPQERFFTTLLKNRLQTQQLFKKNISILSKLLHDSLYRSLEARSGLFTPYYLATPSSEDLVHLITTLFQKTFSRPLLNKSLLLQNLDIITNFFENSVNKDKIL